MALGAQTAPCQPRLLFAQGAGFPFSVVLFLPGVKPCAGLFCPCRGTCFEHLIPKKSGMKLAGWQGGGQILKYYDPKKRSVPLKKTRCRGSRGRAPCQSPGWTWPQRVGWLSRIVPRHERRKQAPYELRKKGGVMMPSRGKNRRGGILPSSDEARMKLENWPPTSTRAREGIPAL